MRQYAAIHARNAGNSCGAKPQFMPLYGNSSSALHYAARSVFMGKNGNSS
jgi:hypothetical protein